METTERYKDEELVKMHMNDLIYNLNPFGYLDLEFCIKTALKIGEDADWVAEQLENYADSIGCQIKELDPCYVVYDTIYESARQEFINLMEFDLWDYSFIVCSNYMCTSFDWKEEDKEKLLLALAENKISIEEDLLRDATFFLDEIGITQEDIDNKIEELNQEQE